MMWKQGKGFTLIELIVTIVILTILTTIVVARLVRTEVGARDREREIDITTIATGLEAYYENGSPDDSIPKGYYPGRQQVDAAAATSPPFNTFLDGVPIASFTSPIKAPSGVSDTDFNHYNITGTNPDGSYTDAQARSILYWVPYLYQPLTRSKTNCFNYADCVKFNLYYLKEETDTVVQIRSKNQ